MTRGVRHSGVPDFNRAGTRRGNSVGGVYPARRVWAEPVNAETNLLRAPGNLNDATISRERMPYFRQGWYAAPDFLVNWTESGPIRPALGMRNVTMRRMQGTSNTRAQDPVSSGPGIQDGNGSLPGGIRSLNYAGITVPTNNTPHGLHTHVRGTTPQSLRRHFSGAPQTRPPRQNRLANSRGAGQSYSQTTVHQGGAR